MYKLSLKSGNDFYSFMQKERGGGAWREQIPGGGVLVKRLRTAALSASTSFHPAFQWIPHFPFLPSATEQNPLPHQQGNIKKSLNK